MRLALRMERRSRARTTTRGIAPLTRMAALSPAAESAPAAADDGALAVFLLEGPRLPPLEDEPAAAAIASPKHAPATMSISKAWQSFIMPSAAAAAPPPHKRFCERAATAVPAAALSDGQVRVRFRYPDKAVPPPRLAAFALPAHLHPDLLDRPRDVCFCLTHADGTRMHGSALQICDADEDGSLVLRALVLVSKWPVFETWHTMLHTIFSRREQLWPAGAPLSPSGRARLPGGGAAARAEDAGDAARDSPRLGALLARTAEVLGHSAQELGWLVSHPLWLPTPLAPLFKALRWQPDLVAYLLAALLTDQKVRLHSEDARMPSACHTHATHVRILSRACTGAAALGGRAQALRVHVRAQGAHHAARVHRRLHPAAAAAPHVAR